VVKTPVRPAFVPRTDWNTALVHQAHKEADGYFWVCLGSREIDALPVVIIEEMATFTLPGGHRFLAIECIPIHERSYLLLSEATSANASGAWEITQVQLSGQSFQQLDTISQHRYPNWQSAYLDLRSLQRHYAQTQR